MSSTNDIFFEKSLYAFVNKYIKKD